MDGCHEAPLSVDDGADGVDKDLLFSSGTGLRFGSFSGLALLHTYRGANISHVTILFGMFTMELCHLRWEGRTHSSAVFIGVPWLRGLNDIRSKRLEYLVQTFLSAARTEPYPTLFYKPPLKRHPANVVHNVSLATQLPYKGVNTQVVPKPKRTAGIIKLIIVRPFLNAFQNSKCLRQIQSRCPITAAM